MSVQPIDLYLAATMRPSEDLSARLSRAAVDRRSAHKVRDRAERTVFANPLRVAARAVLNFFGPTSTDDPFAISYDLTLWPSHRYYWYVDDAGYASHGGFLLRVEEDLPQWLPPDRALVERVLRPWHHTTADVERVLGQPDVDLSWFPQQGWHYGPLPDGRDLVFDFDLGLLRAITLDTSAVQDYGREG